MLKTLTSFQTIQRLSTIFILLFFANMAWAQPPNNDPCNAEVLQLNLSCTSGTGVTGTNVGATNSGITDPACGALSGGADVWYTFTMPDNGYHVSLNGFPIGITESGMAAYAGPDCSNLVELNCAATSGIFETLTVEDGCNFEYAGEQIWIRLWELGNDNTGSFEICAEAHPPMQDPTLGNCATNPEGADECCDAVLFTDDLDGYCGNSLNYSPHPGIADFCANIDNNQWLGFIASETTAEIDISVTNCLFSNGLQVGIFSSTDCNSFSLVSNCWNPNMQDDGTLLATGLTPGEYYYIMVDGWAGDVCDYTLNVVQGVQQTTITPNDYEICAGNSIQLGVEVYGIGPYYYNWTPAGSLDDPTSQYPTATPAITTAYNVHVTGATDTMLTINVDVVTGNPSGLNVTGSSINCVNSNGLIYRSTAVQADSIHWTVTGGGTIVGAANVDSVIINWGGTLGANTVTMEAFNVCGSTVLNYPVSVVTAPDISAVDPNPVCAPATFNLGLLQVNNAAGVGGPITFYTNSADANAGTNALTTFVVSSSATYWVRMESAPGCYDVTSAYIEIEGPQISVTNPPAFCEPNTFDLNNVNIVESNGASALDVLSFHNSLTDATANVNPIANTNIGATGTFFTRYQTINGCVDIEPVTVTVFQRPDITFTSSLEFCAGDCLDLAALQFTDANATTITSNLFFNDLNLANIGLPGLEMTNTVVCNAGTFYMRSSTSDGCFVINQIDLIENPNPSGSISANATACYGESVDLTFNLTGTGPFEVQYSDGTNDFVLGSVPDGHIVPTTVNSDITFAIDTVRDLSTDCWALGTSGASIAVNDQVALTISGDNDICIGGSADLEFALSGDGPFTIVYSDGTNNFTLNNISGPTHLESVSPSTNTTYTAVSVEDNLNCSGTVNGSAVINVGTLISVSNFSETCNALLTGYTISFEITGGDAANYAVSGIAGTFSGNTFTTVELADGASYSFDVSDGSACTDLNFSGIFDCQCSSNPGTMDQTLVESCRGAGFTTPNAVGIVTDPGFVQEYVLHDNAGNSLGTVFSRGPNTNFNLVAGMSTGITYYVSSVVGPDNGIGGIDITHPCYQVSIGTPIIIYDLSDAVISGDAISCSGDANTLTLSITGGVPPFDVIYTDGATQFNLDDIIDGYTWDVNPTSNTTFTLVSIFDNTNSVCQGSVDGSATITIAGSPNTSNLQFECNNTNTQYRVSFDVNDGVPSSYVFTGDLGNYDVGSGVFTSDWMANGANYTFTVDDANGCDPKTVSGSHLCNCTTDAGSMSTQLMEVCESGTAFFTTADPATFDADDVEAFILHNGIGNVPFTIFQMNSIPEFSYDPALVFGDTYYVSRIVASDDGTGSPQTDITIDQCLSISVAQPVIFYPEAIVGISGNLELCEGEDATLVLDINQPGEYNIVYNNGTGDIPYDNVTNGQTISLPMPSTGTITLVSIAGTIGPSCVGSIDPLNNSIDVIVHEFPEASEPILTCNAAGENYTVSFEITGGDPASYVVTGAGNLVGNVFTSDPVQSGMPFSYEITDVNNCPPVVVSGLHTCLCTFDIAVNINADEEVTCYGAADAVLSAQPINGQTPFDYVWSTGESGSFIQNVGPGTYTVVMTDANGCIRENNFLVTEPDSIQANFATAPTICYGAPDGLISVSNIMGGIPDYEIEVGGLSDIGTAVDFNLPAGNYNVTIYDANNCEFVENVTVDSAPEFTVDLGEDAEIKLGDDYDLLAVTSSPLDSIAWIDVPDVTCSFCETQNVIPPSTTTYGVEVYNQNGCPAFDEITVFVDQERPVFIPNVFSPNSDGSNDKFAIFGGGSVEKLVSVRIFDRWGALVYERLDQTVNDPFDGWNGRFKGKMMDPGVYLYSVEVLFIDGKVEMFGGDLTLLK